MVRTRDVLAGIARDVPTTVASAVTDRIFGLTEPLPASGLHTGFVRIPWSSDRSAYGFVPVPLVVAGGGDGPTLLLLAGVFGDEPDAQLAVARIVQSLDPAAMNGRVIAMPMANLPAAAAGTRTSPLDGRNLNRSFPGNVMGTPTSMIADYIERHLMATADIVLDLHSDGRSLRYLPSATLVEHPDQDVQARRMAVAMAFGAANVLQFRSFEDRSTSGAARRAGAVRVGTEIGGPDPVRAMVDGVGRVLAWAGIAGTAPSAAPSPRIFLAQREEDFIHALSDGTFEPARQLGDEVAAGDIAGYLHDLTRPLAPPQPVHFPVGGTVLCTRGSGPACRGDCLMHLGQPADAATRARFVAAAALRWLGSRPTARTRRRHTGQQRRGKR